MNGADRIWARIDLERFAGNLRAIHAALPPAVKLIGVVKADGYGHGALPLALRMQEMPFVSALAVATVEEAVELQDGGVRLPLLVLGYTFPADYPEMARRGIRAAAFTEQMLRDMAAAAGAAGNPMRIHVPVDTGMSRIGVRPDESGLAFLDQASQLQNILVEGAFTHFATADERDKGKTSVQYEKFVTFRRLAAERVRAPIPLWHCSNSAAVLDLPQMHLDAVRPGIILYGLWPSQWVDRDRVPVRPILSLYSRVAFLKDLDAGQEVSYGGLFRSSAPMRVATIPAGYGDGYPRGLSEKGCVLICGKRAPILGRVCMDQFMVDVTDIPQAQVGSLVTLIGEDGEESLTMEELGALSGRFNYELACCLNRRVPRIYADPSGCGRPRP